MAEDKIKSLGEQVLRTSLTRREAIKRAGHYAAAGLAMRTGITGIRVGEGRGRNHKESFVRLGSQEILLPVGSFGLKWFPDGHTTIFRDSEGLLNVFISGGIRAGGSSYLLKGPDLYHLSPHKIENGLAIPVLEPDPSAEFGRDYRGLTSVLKNPITGQMLGIFHAENHYPKGFHASVGLVTSNDNGVTWENPSKIITGKNEATPGETTTGAGQPNAFIKGEEIYLYFIDWPKEGEANIHLAKAPLDEVTNPERWKKYFEGQFSTPGIGGNSSSVVRAPVSLENIKYAAYPSVSKNEALGEFVMAFEDNGGFNFSTSRDGISWLSGQRFFNFEYPQQESFQSEGIGRLWHSYPTLINGSKDSDTQTGESNYLIYSEGIHGQEHFMVGRSVVFPKQNPPSF